LIFQTFYLFKSIDGITPIVFVVVLTRTRE